MLTADTSPSPESPLDLQLVLLDASNISQLRLLNSAILPIHYSEKFYKTVLRDTSGCRLAQHRGTYIGMVCCTEIRPGVLYIMTLGCVPACRRKGVGSALLRFVLGCARERSARVVQLHVHSANQDAVSFYEHFGFKVEGTEEGYYRYLKPTSGFLLEKEMENS